MRIVNCTPHEIAIMSGSRVACRIPPSGHVARVRGSRTILPDLILDPDSVSLPVIDGDPFGSPEPISVSFSQIEQPGVISGLPAPEPGTLYLVSMIAAAAAVRSGRTDIVVVDTVYRDPEGRIIGARGLSLVVDTVLAGLSVS